MTSKASKTRIKTEAAVVAFQNREEANEAVAEIGLAQRERDRITTAMNEELAAVKARYEQEAAPHAAVIKELGQGVQIWAEANRSELLRDGRTKTVRLAAGEISWRTRPPKVRITGEGIVIQALKKLGLDRFLRVKEEIDKSAILADPEAVASVKGISLSQGEDFVIKPFATEIEEVQS